jgi:hypothetical protein
MREAGAGGPYCVLQQCRRRVLLVGAVETDDHVMLRTWRGR